jgi:peptidoglycan/xylan/chitin deacetylase (PgdA/CDA1 family)
VETILYISDPSRIYPGQRLVIPGITPPPTGFQKYVVRPGDTIWAIAQRFGTTVEAITRANNLADPSRIQVGQILLIPMAPTAQPIFRGNPSKKAIAFSFDATYGDNQTPQLLEILRRNNIRTTFFWSGIWPETFPALASSVVRAGHEVGNHSYDHPHMTTLSDTAMREQILRTERIIQPIAGSLYRKYFRPPFGEYNQRLLNVAASLGYSTIMWTIDSLDWTNPGPQAIIDRVLSNIQNGAIILMHQAAPDTPRALPEIISRLFRDGYRIDTVTAVLDPP